VNLSQLTSGEQQTLDHWVSRVLGHRIPFTDPPALFVKDISERFAAHSCRILTGVAPLAAVVANKRVAAIEHLVILSGPVESSIVNTLRNRHWLDSPVVFAGEPSIDLYRNPDYPERIRSNIAHNGSCLGSAEVAPGVELEAGVWEGEEQWMLAVFKQRGLRW